MAAHSLDVGTSPRYTVRLPLSWAQNVEAIAARDGVSVSDVLRRAVDGLLASEPQLVLGDGN